MHTHAPRSPFLLAVCGGAALLAAQQQEPERPRAPQGPARYELRSPDRRIHVELRLPAAGSTDVPTWFASFERTAVLHECRLGLVPTGDADLLAGAKLLASSPSAHDERIPVRFGRADHANDRYEALRLRFVRDGGIPVDVVFRCYDDAIAFRYEVPAAPGHDTLQLADERTSFHVLGDPRAYVQYLENHTTSHEHPVTSTTRFQLATGRLLDVPATFVWPNRRCAVIAEAALRHYAGMSLWREPGADDLTVKLAPRADGLLVVRPLPMTTPWRVVLLANRPGALLESTTTYCLNDPPETDDLAWIRPGKMTWPWWNGGLVEAELEDPILSVAANRAYIDFCAANGIAFHAVVSDEHDTPWYVQSRRGFFPGPDTDATKVRADLDLAAIRAYAEQNGVRLWTWVHHGAVRGHVDAVFAALARYGFAGVMVDFLDHDDQDTVEFAEDVLRAAQRHHVLVHFHGMYEPTGWQRTFPHLTSHEGALNLEYLKWSNTCSPEHDLLIAFTRLVAGPTDYHLGGFRAVRRADFAPHQVAPNVLGTRCHQLALYVCFDNPNPMVADYPAAYRDQPGFDFVVAVPTWWDETRVVQAEIGRWLVTARRRGAEWWLGGLGAGAAHGAKVPLAFLGDGRFTLRLWHDAPDAGADPNQLVLRDGEVTTNDVLAVDVGEDGGFVARLSPVQR